VSSLENVGLEIFGLLVLMNGADVGVVIEVYMGFLLAGWLAGWVKLVLCDLGSDSGGKTTKAAGLVNPAASEEVI